MFVIYNPMSAKESDEFHRLFAVLSAMSKKTNPSATATATATATAIATATATATDAPMKHLVIDETTMTHQMISSKENEPVVMEETTAEEMEDEETNGKMKCEGCNKNISSASHYVRHLASSVPCQRLVTDPDREHMQINPDKPIHCLGRELLQEAMMDPNVKHKCRHCLTEFMYSGNFHRHFYYSTSCNRIAYYEFKKIVAALK